MEIIDKAKKIATLLDDKKATDITILEVKDLTTLSDYFVICSCSSGVQLRACEEEVNKQMKELGFEPTAIEGYRSGTWILMDYSDIIVHIFLEETREFYSMERLWVDANRIDY